MKNHSGCVWQWEIVTVDQVLTQGIASSCLLRHNFRVCATDVVTVKLFCLQVQRSNLSAFAFGLSPIFNRNNTRMQLSNLK